MCREDAEPVHSKADGADAEADNHIPHPVHVQHSDGGREQEQKHDNGCGLGQGGGEEESEEQAGPRKTDVQPLVRP